MTATFPFLTIDPATRRVSLDARDPAFYNDPNPVYAALHAQCPTFYWEEQRQWFFTEYDHVSALPEVRECHMLNGEIDFVLKVVSRDLQSFQEFLTSKLTPAPNVASVKTSLTIRTAKQLPGVPLE